MTRPESGYDNEPTQTQQFQLELINFPPSIGERKSLVKRFQGSLRGNPLVMAASGDSRDIPQDDPAKKVAEFVLVAEVSADLTPEQREELNIPSYEGYPVEIRVFTPRRKTPRSKTSYITFNPS